MQLSDGLIMLLEDREVLTSHVEASKENVDSKIGDKETEIVRTLQEDWKTTETRILDAQHMRNRNIVEEVIKTCVDFREDISKCTFHLIFIGRQFTEIRDSQE